jgi:Insect cuticle protein
MAFKFIALFALLAAAAAAPGQYYEQPALIKSYQPALVKQVVQPAYINKVVEHEAPATYDFEYSVQDDHTGDVKTQHESAKDGVISGYYTLIDADGYKRIVHYTADDVNGFNADVQREPIDGHKVVKTIQPVVVKKIVAQPAIAVQKYVAAAPQYYSAPVEHKYVAAAPQYYSAPAEQKYYSAPAPQYYSAPSHYHH